MKTILLAAALALAPLTAQAASGFCAAKISDTVVIVTVPKDVATKADLEADFDALLTDGSYDKGNQPIGTLIAKPFKGCLAYGDSRLALEAMKGKMTEIEKGLGLRVQITGW